MLRSLISIASSAIVVLSPGAPGQTDANQPGRRRIQARGVQVRLLREPYVHAKIFVVDGKLAFVGSENISTNSLDHNREVGVLLEDQEAIKTLRATFETDWSNGNAEK